MLDDTVIGVAAILGMFGSPGRRGGKSVGILIGMVGRGGKVVGNGGKVGNFGMVVGNGTGNFGNCKSWRPADPTLTLLKNAMPTMHKANKKEFLNAMATRSQWNWRLISQTTMWYVI